MRTDELAMYEAMGELVGKALVLALIVAGIVAIVRHNARVSKSAQAGALAAAAWYPDPDFPDYVRYWDGTQWTDHRQPKPPS